MNRNLSISSATEIDAPETVIYNGSSIIGGNTVRVSDITTLQKHMVLNVDIPTGSLITDLTPTIFNNVNLQVIDDVFPGSSVIKVPAFSDVNNSVNLKVLDISQVRLNFINQNISGGVTAFTLNQRKWMTKTTDIESSHQQNLGPNNFGYIPVPNANLLFVGQYIEDSQFVDENCKIKKIVPFVEVNNLVSKVYGSEKSGINYVDVFTDGITLLDVNDNEPSLFNITSGFLTSDSFPGIARILHTESQGNNIRIYIDKLLITPVGDNTPTQKTLVVPSDITKALGSLEVLLGTITDKPTSND